MFLKPENVFHPFQNTSLGVFLKNLIDEDSLRGLIIDEINLYYQPVQQPLVAITFLGIKLFLLVIGEYLQVKVYRLMEKEKGLVKNITQLLVGVQMIFWLFWVLFAAITDFIHPVKEIFGEWFCYGGAFVFRFLGNIITSHSFMSALMRYIFILHKETADKHGKEKIKNFFFLLSVLLPFLVATWEMVDGPELDGMSFINRCHGKHHRVFLTDTSTLNVAKRNFCAFDNYNTAGIWWKILALLRRISCVTNKAIQLVMGLNIAEGILYYRILSHMKR